MLRRKPTTISISQMDITELDKIQQNRRKSKQNKHGSKHVQNRMRSSVMKRERVKNATNLKFEMNSTPNVRQQSARK